MRKKFKDLELLVNFQSSVQAGYMNTQVVYSYITSCYMEGYYIFLFFFFYFKDKIFNVTFPWFHMACPTLRVSIAQLEMGPNKHEEMQEKEEEEEEVDDYDHLADMDESDEEY